MCCGLMWVNFADVDEDGSAPATCHDTNQLDHHLMRENHRCGHSGKHIRCIVSWINVIFVDADEDSSVSTTHHDINQLPMAAFIISMHSLCNNV